MSTADQDRDDIALAGEYALGLLEGAERAAFEARLSREPHLPKLVDEWNTRLASLANDIEPVDPPEHLRRAIAARIFKASDEGGRVVVFSRRRWLVGGLAIAAALALAVFVPPTLRKPADYVAEVAADDRSVVIAARAAIRTDGVELVANLKVGAPLPDRALELWLIPKDAERPISLGLVALGQPTRVNLPADLADKLAGATLAVSDEPEGGSPTGLPTGVVVAAGTLSAAG